MPHPPPFLFDLDGTLADTIGDIAASTNHVRTACGLVPLPLEGVRNCIGRGASTLLRRALPELGYGDEDLRWHDLLKIYVAHHDLQCTETARLYPGVRTYLTALAERGHRMAVVTNKPERFAVVVVRHLGLAELLPVVVGGDTLPQKKPDPAPLFFALRQLGCPLPDSSDGRTAPTHVSGPGTMVGDGEADLHAGRAAGLRTIACLYGYGREPQLRELGADAYWTRFGG